MRNEVDGGKLWTQFFTPAPSFSLEKNNTPFSESISSIDCSQRIRRIGETNKEAVKKEFKTVSIQTDFRDSATQTDPTELKDSIKLSSTREGFIGRWLKKDTLLLKDADEGNCTVDVLERLRSERDFENSLPPLGDGDALAQRQKMIARRTQKAWKDKETRIKKSQKRALQRFKTELYRREDLTHDKIETRTAQRYQNQTEKSSSRRRIHRSLDHETTRWLTKRFAAKTKNIDAFADVCSALYLPLQRNGVGVKKPADIDDARLRETVTALDQIEEKLSTEWNQKETSEATKKTDRMQLQLDRDLTVISEAILSCAREGSRGQGSCWIAPIPPGILRKPTQAPSRSLIQRYFHYNCLVFRLEGVA